MTPDRFLYTTHPVTKAITRRHADGAAFVAHGHPHALGFWARHPNVAKIVDDSEGLSGSPTDVAIRVWLRDGWADDNTEELSETTAPDGAPDLEFNGPGRMGDAFWLTHPDIEHVEVFNHLGDDSPEQDSWLVKVWLKGGD
ncbi:MAG: hypothetical protein J7521_20475 [Caulobacter sp.]|nr:hypothetical protein [Caulobacter sp.]